MCNVYTAAITPRVCTSVLFIGSVCVSVCVSVKSHLTYGASVRPENAVTYSAGNEGQKICGVFSETAPLQRSSTLSVVRPCVQSAIFPCVFLVYAHAYFSCIYAHDTPPRVQHFSAFINCVAGSEIETTEVNPTPKDCCVRTNNGLSYADSGGNCIVPQCVGKRYVKTSKFTKENYGFKLYNYPIAICQYTRILCCDIPYHSVCTVHGFASTSYGVEEGERLDTKFGLNVKGTTSLPLVILGTITLEAGTASE